MNKSLISLALASIITATTYPIRVTVNMSMHRPMPTGPRLRDQINDFDINDVLNLANTPARLTALGIVGACVYMQGKDYRDTHLDASSLLNPFNIILHPVAYIDDALIGHAGNAHKKAYGALGRTWAAIPVFAARMKEYKDRDETLRRWIEYLRNV
jgi:hypothetical protein